MTDPRAVVAFWRAAGPANWYEKTERFDRLVRLRLGRLHLMAAAGALDGWRRTADGALALLILLDQAPRNLFRGSPRAFVTDRLARSVAQAAVARGFDRRYPGELRQFFYLPFEHSETIEDQRRCVALFAGMGDAKTLHWAKLHADIIERFGRFPHRNELLGRASTNAERTFLAGGGFAG